MKSSVQIPEEMNCADYVDALSNARFPFFRMKCVRTGTFRSSRMLRDEPAERMQHAEREKHPSRSCSDDVLSR